MPLVNISGVSLYYEIPTSPDHTIDPTKNTVVLLAPSFLDITYLKDQVTDKRINSKYNLVCFEPRSHGRTKNEVRSTYDYFVAAADLALALEALKIPPAHVYAAGCIAFQIALKYAVLFPSQILSITFVGTASILSSPRFIDQFKEMDRAWQHPQDEDDLLDAVGALVSIYRRTKSQYYPYVRLMSFRKLHFFFSDYKTDDGALIERRDQVASTLLRRYSPHNLCQTYEVSRPNQRFPMITRKELAAIIAPVLIIHGTIDLCFPLEHAAELKECLIKSAEVQLLVIPEAPHMLHLTHSKEVTDRFFMFLEKHSINPTPIVVPLDLLCAMQTIARLGQNDKVLLRNFHKPESYSLVDETDKARGDRLLADYTERQKACKLDLSVFWEKDPWEPVQANISGLPRSRPWKYSERNSDTQRVPAPRESIVNGVHVEVQAARRTERAADIEKDLPSEPLDTERLTGRLGKVNLNDDTFHS